MQQTIPARHELYEAAIRHYATYNALIHVTYLGNSHDSLDLAHCSINNILAAAGNLNLAYTINLVDCDSSTCLLLHTLDDLAARTYYSTDKLLRNYHLLYTWYMRFQFRTRSIQSLQHLSQNMLTASLCLHQSLLQDLVRQTIALDIHLCSRQTLGSTSSLEVHITQVILITQDIAQYSILILARVLDQTHCNTAHRSCKRHTGIHQGQTPCTYRSH